jgi:hypothetical protein
MNGARREGEARADGMLVGRRPRKKVRFAVVSEVTAAQIGKVAVGFTTRGDFVF